MCFSFNSEKFNKRKVPKMQAIKFSGDSFANAGCSSGDFSTLYLNSHLWKKFL